METPATFLQKVSFSLQIWPSHCNICSNWSSKWGFIVFTNTISLYKNREFDF